MGMSSAALCIYLCHCCFIRSRYHGDKTLLSPSLPQRSVLSTPVGKGTGLNVTVDMEVNLTSFASF